MSFSFAPPRRRSVVSTLLVGVLAATVLVAAPGAAAAAPDITAEVPVQPGDTLGAITAVADEGDGAVLTTQSGGAVRVTFLDAATLRIEADRSGTFTDPANTSQGDPARSANIVVGAGDFTASDVSVSDGSTVRIATDEVTLEVDKGSGRMTLLRADGSTVWQESSPLSFGSTATTQHLAARDGEQFLGGGMQNGRSIHTGATVNISRNFNWSDGGHPNAVPYYMSSAGYGVLRNTFAPGTYVFSGDPTTTHAEKRFDAYYFVGDYKQSLDGYTKLTGRPHMPPAYALEYGDADCYNRSNPTYTSSGFGDPEGVKQHTIQSAQVAAQFAQHDMPAGWMLVNDGYGCEYSQLPETVAAIGEQGLQTGLWTQRALTQQESEVGDAGIRLRKLDVAWVGEGYRLALTGCEAAHDGIEQYSDARGTALMVEGWAGAQRCGMQWTGDHSGNLDAVRWQVSALTGAGNSGLPFTTGDVDGIFGGSTKSYVRDLQWKAFAPALYSMSGWAATDKRPWLYGEEATRINRDYLQLRQRLMPYIYTLAAESHRSGTPMMRSLALEYPDDARSYSAEANNQFLLGRDFLVAPVFTDSDVRNGIVLPEGDWIDYWSGDVVRGGRVLNGYDAPLDTLPVFVRAGAVIPQGIVARNSSLVPDDAPLTLDVYPQGESEFTLYEDDQVTRDYRDGASSSQLFEVDAPAKDAGDVTVTIGTRDGDYTGKAAERAYRLQVHSGSAPDAVTRDGVALTEVADAEALAAAGAGWYFDETDAGGTVVVEAGTVASTASAVIALTGASAVGGDDADAAAMTAEVLLDDTVAQGAETTVRVTATNTGDHDKTGLAFSLELPDGWDLTGTADDETPTLAPGASSTATFTVTPTTSAAGGQATIRAKVDYTARSGASGSAVAANQIYVNYGSLAAAYNHVSITSLATRAQGDFDGGKASFSAEALAAQGVDPGSTVRAALPGGDVDFTWPDYVDGAVNAVALDGQTISVSGQGTHLAVLTSAAVGGGVSPTLTVTYTDGTSQRESLFVPNWLKAGLGSATAVIDTKGRNNAASATIEYAQYTYSVFANSIRLNPSKTVESVTLPVETRVKFFDWKVVSQQLPDAPTGTVALSDIDWVSATNGYGVIGKDVANKDSATSPDVPLQINTTPELKKVYDKGLGVHAVSKLTYYLGGACTSFTTDAGLEDGFSGAVIFRVDVDGTQRYQSVTFTPGFATERIALDVTGAQYLDLRVDPTTAGAINGAHGVWGEPTLVCADADTSAPITEATLAPDPAASGWHTTRPTLTLTASDDRAVALTQYRIGEGGWNTYTEPVALPEGETTVQYRSTDAAGNVEEAATLGPIKVDSDRPTVGVTVDGRRFVVTAADSVSGIAAVEYSLDAGATWTAYTTPVTAPAEGAQLIARAADRAGNASAVSDPVRIEATGTGPEPGSQTLSAPTQARAGEEITVRLAGFAPAAEGELWLFSDPVRLATFTTDAAGAATVTVRVPTSTPVGAHTLRALLGGDVVASTAIAVVAAGSAGASEGSAATGGLAATGSSLDPAIPVAAALLLLAIGAALLVRRGARRRPHVDG